MWNKIRFYPTNLAQTPIPRNRTVSHARREFASHLPLLITGVIAIVTGHVIAVYLAHRTALRLFSDRKRMLASQFPMLALMVAYTMLSLWIIAQPAVR